MVKSFFVSPTGDDKAAGGKARPFATIAQAQLAARKAGPRAKIILADGIHRLSKTLRFGPADSGIAIEAEHPGKAIVSGAREITGWRREQDGVWSAPVRWVASREKGFRMLCVNDAPRPRSRLPKKDFFTACELKPAEGEDWMKFYYNTERPRFEIKPGDINPAWNLANGEVIMYHIWVDSHVIPKSVTVEDGKTWLNLDVMLRRCPSDSIYRIENLREIISEPGEWALDYAKKTVYYLPKKGEDLTKAKVTAPCLRKLATIDGAVGVAFRGVVFADAQFELAHGDRNDCQASYTIDAAINLAHAEGCGFENCEFKNLSGYAVALHAGARDNAFLCCRLHNLGAGGFHLDSGTPRPIEEQRKSNPDFDNALPTPCDRVRGNEIADCEICDYGLDFPSAVGVLIRNAEGTRVHHNAIHDGYYSGVSVGWVWGYLYSEARDNEITDNHIYDIGKGLLSDMGGIYTLGVSPGTKMCHNLIHGIDARYYGGWGLYNDEGSTGILVEDNIVYDTKFSCYHMHFGRDVTIRNNIFGGGRIDQVARSRREPHVSFSFYNNIVYWTEGKLHTGNWDDSEEYDFTYFPGRSRKLRKTTLCDWNIYFNPKMKLADVRFGSQLVPWDEWRRKAGQDLHSAYADPLFKNAAEHDYALSPRSPALKLGFRPIDIADIGPRRRPGPIPADAKCKGEKAK